MKCISQGLHVAEVGSKTQVLQSYHSTQPLAGWTQLRWQYWGHIYTIADATEKRGHSRLSTLQALKHWPTHIHKTPKKIKGTTLRVSLKLQSWGQSHGFSSSTSIPPKYQQLWFTKNSSIYSLLSTWSRVFSTFLSGHSRLFSSRFVTDSSTLPVNTIILWES